jgi:hypothetical protein
MNNTSSTTASRIAAANALAEKAGISSRLVAIRQVLQRARSADVEREEIGEIHTVETDGVRTEIPMWFYNGKLTRAGW